MAKLFGNSLTVDQRKEMNRSLSKKQLAAFDDLFCADTDEDAATKYQELIEVAGDKLPVLRALLTSDQLGMLTTFIQAITQRSN